MAVLVRSPAILDRLDRVSRGGLIGVVIAAAAAKISGTRDSVFRIRHLPQCGQRCPRARANFAKLFDHQETVSIRFQPNIACSPQ